MAMPSGGVSTNTSSLNLPAGFRFHPTDEELIVHYLMNQAASIPCPVPIIAEVNIYQWNPWDLPAKAVFGASGEWYFFSPRDRKYPNGARPNRAAGSGYWKATGTDKAILSSSTGQGQAQGVVGVKKALVFYGGRPPRGVKTDWIMHEYRLADAGKKRRGGGGGSMRLDDWVLCRIHKKSNDFQSQSQRSSSSSDHSTVEQGSPKPEPDLELHPQTTMSRSYSLTDLLNSFDCSALSQMLDDDQEALALPQQNPPLMYPTTTQTHQQQLNYNYNNHLKSLPHTNAAACSADDYLVANNNCNNNGVNKRKRMMMMDDIDGAAESFDDGSNGFSKKPKVLLPSDTRISSSYCNQQVVDTSGLLFQPYSSSSSSLLMSYPFLEMQ